MAHTNGFDKAMAELIYKVHEGDTIRITKLDDPYDRTYEGREGVVEHIDSMGQLHGTWGGLAVIPGEDKFIVLKHTEVKGRIYLFSFRHTADEGRLHIFAGNEARAREIFAENYRDSDILGVVCVREANAEEYEAIKNTGAPAPKKVDKWKPLEESRLAARKALVNMEG